MSCTADLLLLLLYTCKPYICHKYPANLLKVDTMSDGQAGHQGNNGAAGHVPRTAMYWL